MVCHRCNSPVVDLKNDLTGEFFVNCEICGFYSQKFISHFIDDTAIWKEKTVNPLGVVVTPCGHFIYHSNDEKLRIIAENKTHGYTFFNEKTKKWEYKDLRTEKKVTVRTALQKMI